MKLVPAIISVLPSSFLGWRKDRLESNRNGNTAYRSRYSDAHTERLTLTKATTFSFPTFRGNFYRDISRNDNKGCKAGFDAKNKFSNRFWLKNLFLYLRIRIVYYIVDIIYYLLIIVPHIFFDTFGYTVWRMKRQAFRNSHEKNHRKDP